jgi:putative hydrolase of the HAD superfamily
MASDKGFVEVMSYIRNAGIAHVSFDFWNTLYTSNPEFKRSRTRLFSGFSVDCNEAQIDSFFSQVGSVHNLDLQLRRRNNSSLELYKEACRLSGAALENANQLMEKSEELFLLNYPLQITSYCWDVLRIGLAEGLRFSITSNTAFIRGKVIKQFLENEGLSDLFSFFLFSDEVGVGKPQPEIFDALYEKSSSFGTQLKLSQVLHIGDDQICDLEGAQKFGLHAILYKL